MSNRKMKWGVWSLLAAAMLAPGCTKQEEETPLDGIRIYAEGMDMNGDSKLVFNLDQPTITYWYTPGGYTAVNDSVYIFDENHTGHFLLVSGGDNPGRSAVIQFANSVADPYGYHYEGQAFSAVYPWRLSCWKENGTTYEYPQTSTDTIVVGWNSDAYEYRIMSGGKVRLKVPMVAFAEPNATSVMFRHITGAVAFYIKNCTGSSTMFPGFSVEAYRSSDGSPAYLWVNLPDNGFVCSKRNGGVDIRYLHTPDASNASNLMGYNMTSAVSQLWGIIELEEGDSILCVMPIPITNEPTDFTLGTYGEFRERTIRGLKIKRNHMYFLPTFNLETNPNTEKK